MRFAPPFQNFSQKFVQKYLLLFLKKVKLLVVKSLFFIVLPRELQNEVIEFLDELVIFLESLIAHRRYHVSGQ